MTENAIMEALAPKSPAHGSEAAQRVAQALAAIEESALAGYPPYAEREKRNAAERSTAAAWERAENSLQTLLPTVFSDSRAAAIGLKEARSANLAVTTLDAGLPHAIAPLVGWQLPQWVVDWFFPYRLGRTQAFRAIPALREAIVDADNAKRSKDDAAKSAAEYRSAVASCAATSRDIANFIQYNVWRDLIGVQDRDAVYRIAQRHALTVTPDNISQDISTNYRIRLLDQYDRKMEIDELHADVRQHGIDGPRALVIFGKALRAWEANGRSYEQRFSEHSVRWPPGESAPPFEWGYIIFADQALAWGREAMQYMVTASTVILGTRELRESEEAQAMDERGESLLQKVSDFYRTWVEPNKNRGGDGGGEAAVSAWVGEIGAKVGDERQARFRFALHTYSDELAS